MTLVIYDTTGYVIQSITGSYRVPVGLPYLEVDIPEGKYIASVDVTITPNIVVYADLPETNEDKIADLQQSVAELTILLATPTV